jgi:hypothetical protein
MVPIHVVKQWQIRFAHRIIVEDGLNRKVWSILTLGIDMQRMYWVTREALGVRVIFGNGIDIGTWRNFNEPERLEVTSRILEELV